MEQITFSIIAISGLLPLAYMATVNKFPLTCKIVMLYAIIYTFIPIMLTHTELPTVAVISPPIGGGTTLLLYFLIPPRK